MKSNIWRGSATDGVYVPVYRGALTTELTVRYGETEYRMQAAMEDGEAPLYYAYLPGRGEVTLAGATAPYCAAIRTEPADIPDEPERPECHVTAPAGWINDPNGLHFADGVYHAYYQHNPLSVRWGNMTWGHAVSTDLLHWTSMRPVMYPDETGTMYSGSAVVTPDGERVFFYTAAGGESPWSAGRAYTQRCAVSRDGGRTLEKQGLAVDTIAEKNRDPKVFYHAESGAYIMVLWVEDADFAILRSTDLKNWTETQRLTLDGGYECPDLFRLVEADGTAHWIFWTANGTWYDGTFDGCRFEWDGKIHRAYAVRESYAAQTFSGTDRVISTMWIRFPNNGRCFTGALGLPRTLGLTRRGGELMIAQRPVREWDDARAAFASGCGTHTMPDGAWELSLRRTGGAIGVRLGTWALRWDGETLVVGDQTYAVPGETLRLIGDGFIGELFADDGVWYAPVDLSGCGRVATVAGAAECEWYTVR